MENTHTGRLDQIKPVLTPAMDNAELLQLITPNSHGTAYSFNVMRLHPGGCVEVQNHKEEHAILVLEGEARVLLGDDWVTMPRGGFAHIPSGKVHSFENRGDRDTEILILKI